MLPFLRSIGWTLCKGIGWQRKTVGGSHRLRRVGGLLPWHQNSRLSCPQKISLHNQERPCILQISPIPIRLLLPPCFHQDGAWTILMNQCSWFFSLDGISNLTQIIPTDSKWIIYIVNRRVTRSVGSWSSWQVRLYTDLVGFINPQIIQLGGGSPNRIEVFVSNKLRIWLEKGVFSSVPWLQKVIMGLEFFPCTESK